MSLKDFEGDKTWVEGTDDHMTNRTVETAPEEGKDRTTAVN
jgi:hypothetical protein